MKITVPRILETVRGRWKIIDPNRFEKGHLVQVQIFIAKIKW